jgi:hypothetical protein
MTPASTKLYLAFELSKKKKSAAVFCGIDHPLDHFSNAYLVHLNERMDTLGLRYGYFLD